MWGVSRLVLIGVGFAGEGGIAVGVFAIDESATTGSYLSPFLPRHLPPHAAPPSWWPTLGGP